MTKTLAPYGSWKSPITSAYLTSAGIGLGQLEVGPQSVYWCEGRPMEAGRVVIVRRDSEGNSADVTPAGFNARIRFHEYCGGAYTTHGDSFFFSNYSDQRMYRQDGTSSPV